MNPEPWRSAARGLVALRRVAARPPRAQRCELCAAPTPDEHEHLVELRSRRLLCACAACAILFDDAGAARYRRVPREIRELSGFEMDDVFWNGLSIPIGLAFLFRSTASGHAVGIFPSPAGPTESDIDEDAWRQLAALDARLGAMRPDVEALLVNRIRGARQYFIVPIDECYKLTGVVRRHWQGFTGGDALWDNIGLFFDGLKRRSLPERNGSRA